MAMAVWAAEVRKKQLLVWMLILTTLFGLAFIGVKYVEWHDEWVQNHIPGATSMCRSSSIRPAHGIKDEKPLPPDMAQKTQIFFFLYFAMTGMHALHMIIGIGLLFWLIGAVAARRLQRRVCRAH